MKVNLVNLKIILLLFFAILMVWYLADSKIVEMNKYKGFNELSFDLNLFYSLPFIVVLFSCFFKCNQKSPQYILIGLLLCFSYIWFFVFFSVAGDLNTELIFWGGFIFLLPVILLVLTEKYLKINYKLEILKHGLIKLRVEFVITIILLFVFIVTFVKINIDFSFLNLYERRILAREKVTGLLGYFFQMSSNGFAPILAFLAIYNRNYNLDTRVLRPFNVFGPGQNKTFLIPKIICEAITSGKVQVKDLEPRRDYIYVDDISTAIIKLIKYGGPYRIFNIGTGYSHSVLNVIQAVQKILG